MTSVCHSVKGGKLFVDHSWFDVVAVTDDAVYGWCGEDGTYMKFSFKDGSPRTDVSYHRKKKKRKHVSKDWDEF